LDCSIAVCGSRVVDDNGIQEYGFRNGLDPGLRRGDDIHELRATRWCGQQPQGAKLVRIDSTDIL